MERDEYLLTNEMIDSVMLSISGIGAVYRS